MSFASSGRSSQQATSSKAATTTRKNKMPQPTVVWGICGYWFVPNASFPAAYQNAANDAAANAGPFVVSIPPSQLIETTASQRYFQSSVTGFQPICVPFHVGACGSGSSCEQLHVHRHFISSVLCSRNSCCGECGDAFTVQLLEDVPLLNHLALDLLVGNGSLMTLDPPAALTADKCDVLPIEAPSRPSPGAADSQGHIYSHPEDATSLDDSTPPLMDFEFDVHALDDDRFPAAVADTLKISPISFSDSPPLAVADALAASKVTRRIPLKNIAITTALQRGDPGVCVDHLISRHGCSRGKDCSKFHLCRKVWQEVYAELPVGGSLHIRVAAA